MGEPRSNPRLTRGQPMPVCDRSARRPLRAPCCSCWGVQYIGRDDRTIREPALTEAWHWAALLSLTTGQGIAPMDSRHWEGCIVRWRSHLAYMYCSVQPCLASSQSLVYLLWVCVAKWCEAYYLTKSVFLVKNLHFLITTSIYSFYSLFKTYLIYSLYSFLVIK